MPCSQLLKHLRSKIEFLAFHQPKPLFLLVACAPIHPGHGWIHTECPSLTPTTSSPASGLHLAGVILFSLLLNTHTTFHPATRETFPKHSQPGSALHTSRPVQLSDCGHGPETRLSWANRTLPIFQCLNMKTKGEIMATV